MPKATVNYGKYSVEVEAPSFVELLKQVAVSDDVFGDAFAVAEIEGKVEVSEDVIVTHRVTDQGHHYFSLRCNKGKLKGYTRDIGQYNTPRIGDVYTKRKPKEGEIQGYNGWSKYDREQAQRNGSSYGQQHGRPHGQQSGQQAPPPPPQTHVDSEAIPF